MTNNNKKRKDRRSYFPLIWIVLYILNVAAILLFQITFIHVYDRPVTKENLKNVPYFQDLDVLDIVGEDNLQNPSYVLYRNLNGQQEVVKLDFNLIFQKFGVDEKKRQPVSADGMVTFDYIDGYTKIVVKNDKMTIHSTAGDGGRPHRLDYIYQGLILLLAEGIVLYIIEKRKRQV